MYSRPLTILLVDDDGRHASLVRDAVRGRDGAGDRLLEARGLSSGLEMAAREHVDVLLLDLANEGAPGVTTLQSLRTRMPELPVVVITEAEDHAAAALALVSGAQDHITGADIGNALLSRSLRYAVDRHRMQRTLQELSLTDELTGLYNVRGFTTFAEHHLRLAVRTRGLLAGVLVIEDAGDSGTAGEAQDLSRALLKGAELLRCVFRASDVLARTGDREFAMLAVDAAPDAVQIIERRMEKLARGVLGSSNTDAVRLSAVLRPTEPLDTVAALFAQLQQIRAERQLVGA